MRRLPVYFLIDVSESMVGEPIEQVQNGMRTIVQELRTDPYALETVFISVIAFAGKAITLQPLTELYKFYPPIFPIGGGTSLGTALNYLMDDIDKSIIKTTLECKGDWKPIIFLFTDGNPTDDCNQAIERWNKSYKKSTNLIVISIGNNVDTKMLGRLTENVLRLSNTDEMSFKAFFKWVTASIKTTSVSVADEGSDEVKLAPISNINLEKVDINQPCQVDENFTVLLGKCSSTKKMYLVKYARQAVTLPEFETNVGEYFKLIGAYTIDEKAYEELPDGKSNKHINTDLLIGQPTCPCCGNQFGVVVCECGNISCADPTEETECPWCGQKGNVGEIAEGGININRGKG